MGGSSMMPGIAFVAVAAFLVVLLLLSTRDEKDKDLAPATMRNGERLGSEGALQPAELVLRIFSPKDREFIGLTHSPRLQRLYQEERRKVALHWVRRTSREVSAIMLRHRLNSRYSQNVNVVAETKLVGQYLELRFLCGVLLFLIQLFGPHALADLATYAGKLYERLGSAMPDAKPVSQVASSGNVVVP
jgi:hypothetical protein